MSFGYRRVWARMWKDPAFRTLSLDAKLLAIYLISGQSNRIGLFAFSKGLACEDLNALPADRFEQTFREVLQRLGWHYDDASSVLWIPSWWRYQAPENPNVLVGSLRDLEELPETPLLEQFFANVDDLKSGLRRVVAKRSAKRLAKRSGNVSGTFQERSGIKEKEKEKEKEKKKANTTIAPPAVCELFEGQFWSNYPARHGRKLGKPAALRQWAQLSEEERQQVAIAVGHYANSPDVRRGIGIKDPARWLRNGKGDAPWKEWLVPAEEVSDEGINAKDFHAGAF